MSTLQQSTAMRSPTHNAVRPEWLASRVEQPLDPALPIVDSHHHLYDRPGSRYLLDNYLEDLYSGHNVRATVIVQARSMLNPHAQPDVQPLGETEFANGVAAMSASGIYGDARVCAGIVGFADLTLGDRVRPVLESHIRLAGGTTQAGGRFCGVRQSLPWDADATLLNPLYPTTQDTMDSSVFRQGFSHLAPLGLSFEAWVFFHQLPKVAALARAFPETQIVLNHCGGVVGVGPYAGRRDEVFREWRRGLIELCRCPNVMVKLSGLGMRLGGFGFDEGTHPPKSTQLAAAWQPWIETCIAAFGPQRCMYGSNFPVDKGSLSYAIGLNALKHLTRSATEAERANIFWRSAKDFYRLSDTIVSVAASASFFPQVTS